MFNAYSTTHFSEGSTTQSGGSASQSSRRNRGKGLMSRFGGGETSSQARSNQAQEEWTRYMDTPVIVSEDLYDVLAYWTKSTDKPILQRVARDVLAAQASSCASERCFSASGRILSSKRMSLKHEILEALVCYKDFFDSEYQEQDKDDEMKRISSEYSVKDNEGEVHPMHGNESENEDEVVEEQEEEEEEETSDESIPSEENYYPTHEYYYNSFQDDDN